MSDSGDDRLRSAWAKQTDQSLDVDPANAEANVRRRRAAIASVHDAEDVPSIHGE